MAVVISLSLKIGVSEVIAFVWTLCFMAIECPTSVSNFLGILLYFFTS